MFLYFCIIVYILGVIRAFVRYIQTVACSAFGKSTPKNNILGEFQRNLFPYYIVWLWMLFLVILYLLEHFKVRIIVVSNKSLHSAFRKEKFIFLKIVVLRNKVVTFFRWEFSCLI
jgi:hypothetical protein